MEKLAGQASKTYLSKINDILAVSLTFHSCRPASNNDVVKRFSAAMFRSFILPDTPFFKFLISMLYYFRETHRETNAVFRKEHVNVDTMHLKWRKSDAYVAKYWPETKLCS